MDKKSAVGLLCILIIGWLSFVSIMSIGNTSEIRVNFTKIESIFSDIGEIKTALKDIKTILEDKL